MNVNEISMTCPVCNGRGYRYEGHPEVFCYNCRGYGSILVFDWFATSWFIDYAGDNESGDSARITPDPAGEDVTADDGRPVDVLRTAWHFKATMARLYGTYSAKAQRAAAVFDALFATRNVKFA